MDANGVHVQAMDLYRAGSFQQAVGEFEKARAAFFEEGNKNKAALAANDLGVVYYALGRLPDARQSMELARSEFEALGDLSGQAKTIGNLAQLMNKQGDKANAEKNYAIAADLFHRAGERAFEADTYRALSQMQLQRGRILEALATFDRALEAKGGSRLLRWFLQIPLRLAGVRN